jgi:O-antigen/teichoic acid export membrane protein
LSIRTGFSDVLWGYAGTVLRFGSSLLVLPIVLKTLPSEQLGIWYIFQTLNGLIALMDFGFSGTIIRNIAYAWAGVTDLAHTGVSTKRLTGPNIPLLWNVIITAKRIYLVISLGALIVSAVFGTGYLISINKGALDQVYLLSAWGIFLSGLFLNLYYNYWNAILSGLGMIKQFQKANVISGIVYLAIALPGILLGAGIAALAAAFLLSGFTIRILSRHFFAQHMRSKGHNEHDYKKITPTPGLFSVLWHNARKNGLTSLGSYLVMQFNIFFIPVFIDLKTSAMYGLAIQIVRLITQFGNVPSVSSYAEMNCLIAEGNVERLKSKISLTYMLGFIIMISAAIFVVLFGNFALRLINSKTFLPPLPIISAMLVIMMLEWSNGIFCLVISASNRIPFMRASLTSGVLISVCGFILMKFADMGLWAVLIPQFVIQSSYNYWRWHRWVFRELDTGLLSIMANGLIEIAQKGHDKLLRLAGPRKGIS